MREARLGRRQLLDGEAPPPFRVIRSEAVLRTSLRDVEAGGAPLAHRAHGEGTPLTVVPPREGPARRVLELTGLGRVLTARD